jgi:hypothetical protein
LGAKDADGYGESALGRQIAGPLFGAVSQLIATKGSYLVTAAEYARNRKNPMFEDKALDNPWVRGLYQPDSWIGSGMGKLFVPEDLREEQASARQTEALRQKGLSAIARSGYGNVASQGVRALLDVASLAHGGMSRTQQLTVLSDTASLSLSQVEALLHSFGAKLIGRGGDSRGLQWLRGSQLLGIGSSSLLLAAGIGRSVNEISKLIRGKRVTPSSLFHGALDMGNGASGMAYSAYVVRAAMKTGDLVSRSNALLGILKLPASLQTFMRVFGSAGAAAGLFVNGSLMIDSFLNPHLSDPVRGEQRISSALGLGGSLFMLGGALMITPATMPIAGLLFSAGSGLLIAQSAYDLRDQIARMGKKVADGIGALLQKVARWI